MTENPTATLTTAIADMHAAITQGLQAIERQSDMLKSQPYPQALAAVLEFEGTLRTHLTMLDTRMKALGGRANQPLKGAVSSLAGFFAGLIDVVRAERPTRALCDDYTFLSRIAIGYLTLYTTATALSDRETAIVAEHGYRDAARLVMLIDRILPAVVIQELRQKGLRVADVAGEILPMIPAAWKRHTDDLGLGLDA
jgi:hypothetical protein